MKIATRTPDTLVISDTALVVRAGGAFCTALGVLLAVIGVNGAASGGASLFPVAVGGVLAFAGLLAAILPRSSTFAFDRARRAFIVTRRSVRGFTRQEVELRDIASVEVEDHVTRDAEGAESATYRVVTVLRDGRRLPWTSYYTSEFGQHAAVAAAREFLELEPTPTRARFTPGSLPITPATRRTLAGLMMLATAFCSLFFAIGVRMVYQQQYRLSTYEPVMARVTDVRIDTSDATSADLPDSYAPAVTYQYEVDGRSYSSSRATPMAEHRSNRWATTMAAHYVVGRTYLAYYDPRHPEQSYLVRDVSVLPYVFVLFPALLLGALGFAAVKARNAAAVAQNGEPGRWDAGRGVRPASAPPIVPTPPSSEPTRI